MRDEHEGTYGVGRIGVLDLGYVRRGRETILSRCYSRSPWHLFPPITLDETGCAYTLLLNPSGGLVGGDRLAIRARVGAEAHVLFSTPSSNRVYRSLSKVARQSVELTIESGALVEWVPEPTIPFAGSRFQQEIDVRVGPRAAVLLWDAIAAGRIARGERWAFTSLGNEIRITAASGATVLERSCLGSHEAGGGLGLAGEWNYVASLYVISDKPEAGGWKRLENRLAEILEEPSSVLASVSEPAAPGLAIKLLARSAPDLSAMQEVLWRVIRSELWGLPLPALRRY